jgi:alkylation response protein AidB-like acyl-CoA dehydrogenase
MRFDLTADQRLLLATTAEYLENESPLTTVRELRERGVGFDAGWWRGGAELGWTSLLVPEELGGGSVSGDGLLDATIIAEQMGRLIAPGPFIVTNVVAAALAEASNAGEHRKLLDALLSGEQVATWACYAPDRGWDPAAAAVTAQPDGDGYRLTGVHDRVEFGDQADQFLVLADTGNGLSQFVVPRDAAGLRVAPLESLDMVRRVNRLEYRSVAVPAASAVGAVGGAAAAIERQLQLAVVLQCAELVGAVERVLEFTMQWMFDRYSFGRPLASYQALKHRVADMKLWSEACQGTMAAAADAVSHRTADAAELVSVAKSYVGQRATDIVQDCVQLHGGLGVTWEHDIHLYLRRVTVDRVTWGTPSEHRRRIADLLQI